MKVGEKRLFNFDKGNEYQIKEIIDNPDLTIEWDWRYMVCPHCHKEIREKRIHNIERIEVLQAQDGSIEMMGITKDKKYMRLPNKNFHPKKDMTEAIKNKSKYLKELQHGN